MVPILYLYLSDVPYGYVAGYYQKYPLNTNTITTTCITLLYQSFLISNVHANSR